MSEDTVSPVALDGIPFRDLLFHPRTEPRTILPQGCQDLDVTLEDGAVLAVRIHLATDVAPIILFFHGNGETISDYDEVGPLFTSAGLSLACISYRGYGWSTGEPRAACLFEDASAAFDAVRKWCEERNQSGPFFVMGRSLGSASAIDLAFRFPQMLKGLIIESGFADTLPLMATLGANWREETISEDQCFGNRRKIASIELPTLIIHGARDELIPVAEAEILQAESGARNKQFQIVPGATHNTVLAVAGTYYSGAIKQFVDGVTGVNTWRERRKRFKQQATNHDGQDE